MESRIKPVRSVGRHFIFPFLRQAFRKSFLGFTHLKPAFAVIYFIVQNGIDNGATSSLIIKWYAHVPKVIANVSKISFDVDWYKTVVATVPAVKIAVSV